MFEIGRLVVKTAGRDSNKKAVIVDILENNYVLIDGETRRKKCNTVHLEPLKEIIKIKKGASHAEVKKALESAGIKVRETKPKEKKEKPRKQRKLKESQDEEDAVEEESPARDFALLG